MTTDPKAPKPKVDVPTSAEFSRTMGHVTWLMTLSQDHRDKPISLIEAHVAAPLMFKQVRVITKGDQPIAAVIWAYASPEVKQKIEAGGHIMALPDWRSGPEIVVVDCISPMTDGQIFIDQFMRTVKRAQENKPERESKNVI